MYTFPQEYKTMLIYNERNKKFYNVEDIKNLKECVMLK